MIRAHNHKAIADRGGEVWGKLGNESFRIVKCKRCGRQYLHEHEVGLVYPDPKDLSKHFLMEKGGPYPACSGCGDPGWSYEQIDESEKDQVEKGPWAWALENP